MAATLTVTGAIGVGTALTAKVFSNVLTFQVETAKNLLSFTQEGTQQTVYIDITSVDTVTATKSGTTWTLSLTVA